MPKKTKKHNKDAEVMSFSLHPETARYIREKAEFEGKTQSRIFEEWAQHFIKMGA